MVFKYGSAILYRGSGHAPSDLATCDTNLNCNQKIGLAVVFSNTQPPCYNVTCSWYTEDIVYTDTLIDFSSVGKQLILDSYVLTVRGDKTRATPYPLQLYPSLDTTASFHAFLVGVAVDMYISNLIPQDGFFPAQNIYFKKIKCYDGAPECVLVSSNHKLLGTKLFLIGHSHGFPAWATAQLRYSFFYEASPLLIADIDYNSEYVMIGELRRAIGYKADLEHVGWNLDDIVRIAKQYLRDRPWIAIDDAGNTVLYGVTVDDVREILRYYYINKVTTIDANIDRAKIQELINKYKKVRGSTT